MKHLPAILILFGTVSVHAIDTDGDGLDDSVETNSGIFVSLSDTGTNPGKADTDSDGLTDYEEVYGSKASLFEFVDVAQTWGSALLDAQSRGGNLAVLRTEQIYDTVISRVYASGSEDNYWIGLTDEAVEGQWKWIDGTDLEYDRWAAGEPNNSGNEDHVMIWPPIFPEGQGKRMVDHKAYFVYPYVLQRAQPTDPNKPDTDNDGLTDGAEANVYVSNPVMADSDGDGYNDLAEVNTGFDPALASSHPGAFSTIHNAVEFRFAAAIGVSYRIESSTNLTDWATLEGNILGTGDEVVRFYSTRDQPRRYFRVQQN